MIGYVSEAVATALKKWQPLKSANVIPVRATEGDSVVVNTPLPAIAVHVVGDEGEGNTFFGGGIRQYFEIQLHCMIPAPNYTFTFDKGAQANLLDLSDEIIRCMERTTEFTDIQRKHDFNIQFDSMDTDTAYATSGANSVTVDVHKIVYKGSVEFDIYGKDKPADVTLGEVDIEMKK